MAQVSNREQWRKRVELWKDSGLSAREFAAEMGLNYHALRYWSWRLRVDKRSKGSAAIVMAAKPRFIEVTEALTGAKAMTEGSGLELQVSDVVIRVLVGFDERTLRQLLAVVRQP
jgi:hypothetical protein